MTKLRVVVLDGLDWAWCAEHMDTCRELWNIADSGCAGLLEACKAPVTSDAVATLLTGRDLEMHFITDDKFTNSQDLIRAKPWFSELSRYGMSLSLCNVPLTWPAFPLPGEGSWMTSGYPVGAPRDWCWGLDIKRADAYPLSGIIADSHGGPGGSADAGMMMRADADLVTWCLGRAKRCTLEIIWLRSSDSIGHHAWGTESYANVVRHLSRLTSGLRAGCDNLLVISDHGFDSVTSDRVSEYMATNHGPTTLGAGLTGAHTMDGVLFAAGENIKARGILGRQSLYDVAGGIFDVLGIPPAPGMRSVGPDWAKATSGDEDKSMRDQLRDLGYVR